MDLWNTLNDNLSNTILHPQYFMKKGEHQTLETLTSLAKKSKKPAFIDIGAGRQWYRNKIESYISKYYALDHPKYFKHYKSSYPIDIFADLNKKINFKNNFFDLCLAIEVFELVENPQKALININKILKKNALLVIYALDNYPPHGFPPYCSRFTANGLKSILIDSGFSVKKIINVGNFFETYATYINVFLMETAKSHSLFLLFFFYPIILTINIVALILGRNKVTKTFNIAHLYITSSKTRP